VSAENGQFRENLFIHGGSIPGSIGCIDAYEGGEIAVNALIQRILGEGECCCYISVNVKYKHQKINLVRKSSLISSGPFWQGSYSSGWMLEIPN
jgi:hypothetical protein